MSEAKIASTDKEITVHDGIVLLQKKLQKMNFMDFLGRTPLPQPGSNRGMILNKSF